MNAAVGGTIWSRRAAALRAIKAIHTLAWFSLEACMVYVLYAACWWSAGERERRLPMVPTRPPAQAGCGDLPGVSIRTPKGVRGRFCGRSPYSALPRIL
jgi:hypothetical protein